MTIDLDELIFDIKDRIILNEELIFSDELMSDTSIKKIDSVKFVGEIDKNITDEIVMRGNLSGVMTLEDSISLELIKYPFNIEIDELLEENLENNQNSIDIIPILWQNIVLEVPLRYTEVKDFSKYSGDGWKLISEEEVRNTNNPFLELSEKFKEE